MNKINFIRKLLFLVLVSLVLAGCPSSGNDGNDSISSVVDDITGPGEPATEEPVAPETGGPALSVGEILRGMTLDEIHILLDITPLNPTIVTAIRRQADMGEFDDIYASVPLNAENIKSLCDLDKVDTTTLTIMCD